MPPKKGTKPRRKAKANPGAKPKPKAPRMPKNGETAMLKAHAAMLYDPCNARLSACVGRGDAGIMQRFSTSFNVGTGVGATAGYLVVVPGAGLITSADLAATTTASTATYAATSTPGYALLNANSANMRCVGCCVEIMPLAAESSRAGWFALGNVAAGLIPQGGSVTPDGIAGLLPTTMRVGDGSTSIKWSPGSNDDLYNGLGLLASNTDNNAVAFVWGNCPAAVGFRIRITAIVEWRPKAGMGMVDSAVEVSGTRSTLDDVKRFLTSKDPNWWWSVGKSVFNAAKTVATFGFDAAALAALAL